MKKIFMMMAVAAMTMLGACGGSSNGNDSNAANQEEQGAAVQMSEQEVVALLEKGTSKDDCKKLTPDQCLAIADFVTQWSDEGLKNLEAAGDEAAKLETVKATIAAHPMIVEGKSVMQVVMFNDDVKTAVGVTPEQVEKMDAALKAYNKYYETANKAHVSKPLFDLD